MTSIVFETKSDFDIRAVTSFGVNSKPNNPSPIGYFGTGLKYAIAVCVRHGLKVEIVNRNARYTFSTDKDEFRGKEFDFVAMREHNTVFRRVTQMPYTTELGKNWKLWQAFRELYSNTLDESGIAYETGRTEFRSDLRDGSLPVTRIVITGPEFVEEYEKRSNTFLDGGVRDSNAMSVQIIDRPSDHVYYRGMRVMDLAKPSVLTYNILSHLELTEDRTIKYSFYADVLIKGAIVTCDNPVMVEKVLTAPEDSYEHRIDFKDINTAPSQTFVYVTGKLRDENTRSNYSAWGYVREHDTDYQARLEDIPLAMRLLEMCETAEWDKVHALIDQRQLDFMSILRSSMGVVHHSPEPDTEDPRFILVDRHAKVNIDEEFNADIDNLSMSANG